MSLRLGLAALIVVACGYVAYWVRVKLRDLRYDREEREAERELRLMLLRQGAREFAVVDYDALDDEELTVDVFEKWFERPCAPNPKWLVP